MQQTLILHILHTLFLVGVFTLLFLDPWYLIPVAILFYILNSNDVNLFKGFNNATKSN